MSTRGSFPISHAPIAWILVVGALLPARCARAEDESLPTEAVRATLFKNGFSIVEREADVPGAGTWRLDGLQSSSHGSFWVTSKSPRMRVEQLRSSDVTTHRDVPLASLGAIVDANPGRWLHLTLADREIFARVVPGKGAPARNATAPPTPQILALETEAGVEWIPASAIRGIRVPAGEAPLVRSRRQARQEKALSITTSAAGRLRIVYLTAGLTWAPSYRLVIGAPNEARLDAKALVINDIERFEATELRFATGFPELAFDKVPSPLLPHEHQNLPVNQFLRALQNPDGRSRGHGNFTGQQVSFTASSQAWSTLGPGDTSSLGTGLEGFYLISRPNVDLVAGDRVYYDLDAVDVETSEIYRWSIGDRVDQRDQFLDPATLGAPEVRRVLTLENASGRPWTTAPITIERDGLFLAQQILPYTPAGASTEVEIGRGVDVRVRETEAEIGREQAIEEPWSGVWDRVEMAGTLEIQNYTDKAIRLETRKTLSGDMIDDGGAVSVVTGASQKNRHNRQRLLLWDQTVEPRSSATIEYRYTLVVRM